MENPLNISDEDLVFCGDIPIQSLDDSMVIIRNEGARTAKKRTKNILVFNPNHYESIHMNVLCNARIANSGISSDDSTYTKNGKKIDFEFKRQK